VLARPRSAFTARIAGLDLVPGVVAGDGLRTPDGLTVVGHVEGVIDGEPAVAVFPPSAVAVYTDPPSGSPRNVLPVRLAALEPVGDLVRLRATARPSGPSWVDGLAAEREDLAAQPFEVLAALIGVGQHVHGTAGWHRAELLKTPPRFDPGIRQPRRQLMREQKPTWIAHHLQ
jgi:hypothetical protein